MKNQRHFCINQNLGLIAWIVLMATLGILAAYICVYDDTLVFLFSMCFIITAPLLIIVLVVVPIIAIVNAERAAIRNENTSKKILIATPFVGYLFLYLSFVSSNWLMTKQQLSTYLLQIDAARRAGSDVNTPDVQISLGPPVIAHFEQPTMMWFTKEKIYDESDALVGLKDTSKCARVARPLGGHFYLVSGTC